MKGTLLITRPAPDGTVLAQALQKRGWHCMWQPLIDIQSGQDLPRLLTTLKNLRPGDILIAVSKHAIEQAQQHLSKQDIAWPNDLTYLAIGEKTASHWQSYGASNVAAPIREDSEGLLALPLLSQSAGQRVVILRGQSGRTLLAHELRHRGFQVEHLTCYTRVPIKIDGNQLIHHCKQAEVRYLLISSGEMLQQMIKLAKNDLHWLRERGLIVVSQRIADMACGAGFKKIIVSKGVAPLAVEEALNKLMKV